MKGHVLMLRMILFVGGFASLAVAQEACTDRPGQCEPGYRLIQEITYQEVEHACCKEVPNMRKKWVYCSKPDYFCVPNCRKGCCGRDGGCCGDGCCQEPHRCNLHCREQLMKKQVECQYGTKCVVEITKEKVPCVIWRKVPCAPVEHLPAPLPTSAPAPVTGAPSPVTVAPQ